MKDKWTFEFEAETLFDPVITPIPCTYVARPTLEVEEAQTEDGMYIPIRGRWRPVDIEMKNISEAAVDAINDWFNQSFNKRTMTLKHYCKDILVERWTMYGAFIIGLNCSYEDDQSWLRMTITYDQANFGVK